MIDKAKNIFYKDGLMSHTGVAEAFHINEDEMVKVDYDWVARTVDIFDENAYQNTGEKFSFKLTNAHWDKIMAFCHEKVGTKERVLAWLDKNVKDPKIKAESINLLNDDGQAVYVQQLPKKKTFDLQKLGQLFRKFPNLAWGGGNGRPSLA